MAHILLGHSFSIIIYNYNDLLSGDIQVSRVAHQLLGIDMHCQMNQTSDQTMAQYLHVNQILGNRSTVQTKNKAVHSPDHLGCIKVISLLLYCSVSI